MSDATFTAARVDREKKFSFDIRWYPDNDSDETETSTFHCYPGRVPGGMMFDVIRIDNRGSQPFWAFWHSCMDPAEYERWFNFTHEEPGKVDADTIKACMDRVIEFDAGRPTEPSSS